MKIVLSIEPVRFPLTGIGRYTYELASALQASASLEELLFFGSKGFVGKLPEASPNGGASHGLKRLLQSSRLASDAYRLVLPLIKGHALRNHAGHLFHSPNFYIPPFPGKSIATFHDLSPFLWSDCAPKERARFMQKELLLAVRRGDAFITDSEYNRQEMADYFSISSDRIHAVPLAAGDEFQPRPHEALTPTLNRYGLQAGQYSLYVGTIEPRKNLMNLLAAYQELPLNLRQRWPLVLAGYAGWRSEAIHRAIEKATREGWARYLGFVGASELPLLFAGARLFCFPSLYEGFGLPVLEAMKSGVPVVCSNTSSLPEVAGKAALMSDPQDVVQLSSLIRKGLEDNTWRETAIAAGESHARTFSWQRCAMETQQVYRFVMES